METTDVIVVGGGPAGISAAITIARAGLRVILIERGRFSGAKNVFGGAIYTQILLSFPIKIKMPSSQVTR